MSALWLIAIAVPLALWAVLYGFSPRGMTWAMDFGGEAKSFFYLFDRYHGIAKQVFWVSVAGALVALHYGVPAAPVMLGAAAVYALLFQWVLLWAYEIFLHRTYTPSVTLPPYPTGRYSLVLTLGISTVVFFVLGVASVIANWK